VKELLQANEQTHLTLANDIAALNSKNSSLMEELKVLEFASKDMEKEKLTLERANQQIMKDYKNDLDVLKKGMKTKAEEDELLFKRVLDEKGRFKR
jgi:SMC interacting uncharacterized protein involved in chromosome segregation